MFTAALFVTVRTWKQPRCPSTGDWIKKLCCIYTIECCCCCCLVAKSGPTLSWPHGPWPTRLLCPWDSAGKNTGVGCHFLLQEMLLTQRSDPRLLHRQASSLPLSHQGNPLCHESPAKFIPLWMYWLHAAVSPWICHSVFLNSSIKVPA